MTWAQSDWSDAEAFEDDADAFEGGTDYEPDGVEAEPATYYANLDDFIRDYLRYIYGCKVDGRNRVWAAEWWRYAGAVTRLEAIWRAWEHLRRDGATGTSVWLRDHADPHMAILFDPSGPFENADPLDERNHSGRGGPLPYAPPPAGLYAGRQ